MFTTCPQICWKTGTKPISTLPYSPGRYEAIENMQANLNSERGQGRRIENIERQSKESDRYESIDPMSPLSEIHNLSPRRYISCNGLLVRAITFNLFYTDLIGTMIEIN